MTWMLEKQFTFDAAHKLPNHAGKCSRLHGHTWVGIVVCRYDTLQQAGPAAGMGYDFGDLKAAVESLNDAYLDHRYLNESTGLDNPTSEELARWIYDRLKPGLPELYAVIIRETPTSTCRYCPDAPAMRELDYELLA